MTFNHVHIRRRQPRLGQCRLNNLLLCKSTRCREPVRRTIRVNSGATNYAQYMMPVTPRVLQTLEEHETHALGPAGAVCITRVRTTTAIRGQASSFAERNE